MGFEIDADIWVEEGAAVDWDCVESAGGGTCEERRSASSCFANNWFMASSCSRTKRSTLPAVRAESGIRLPAGCEAAAEGACDAVATELEETAAGAGSASTSAGSFSST